MTVCVIVSPVTKVQSALMSESTTPGESAPSRDPPDSFNQMDCCCCRCNTYVCVCSSYSRRTGHYTFPQNQRSHRDRYEPSAAANGAKPSAAQPLSVLSTSVASSPRSSSPRHSPNSRPRQPPTCLRCNSQVGVDCGIKVFDSGM